MFLVTTLFTNLVRSTLAVVILLSLAAAPGFAQTATYHDAYTIQGFSQPGRISQVASSTTGILHSLAVNEGDRVLKGECLVRLDRRVHDQKLELARVAKDSVGDLQSAEAELAAKSARLTRLNELSNRNHATAVELMQAQEDVAIARANILRVKDRLAQAAADHARLLAESEQHCIAAPFDGVVVEFTKEAGEYVGPGEAVVCTIAELDALSVEFLLPRHYRTNFNVGDQVDVVFTISGQTVEGIIQYISPFPNGETNTFMVKARVDNSSGQLMAGERCQLKVRSDTHAESSSASDSQLTVRGR
jgi:membrane fusion protein (multidrug efflux system)